MRILILGAAGMVGRKLTQRLCRDGALAGQKITSLHLVDVIAPTAPEGAPFKVERGTLDVSDAAQMPALLTGEPQIIFHLAAIVSGEAEQNFEKGYAINMDGTRHLLEAIRLHGNGYCPRLIFTSSIAVFGAPFPEAIEDDFFLTPLTSYGTQKAICELLLSDYSRKGFVDGIGLRLPTICVRPGKPNLAASGFFSGIIREPLAGLPAILPVSDKVRHWHASPRAAVNFLIHAAGLDTQLLGARRNITLPGLSVTVAEQIEALRQVAGEATVRLIKHQPAAAIDRIVAGWPQNFNARRALDLGFRAERDFAEIIRVHIEDEMPGK